MIERITQIVAKAEATPGTAESVLAADGAFNIFNSSGITPNIASTKRRKQGGPDNLAAVPGGLLGSVSFEVDLVGNGATGLPKWATVFLPACGYAASGSTYTRTLTTANQVPITIAEYTDGLKKILAGAVGTFQVMIMNGQIGRVKFNFTGKYWDEVDASILSPTYPTVIPPRGYESFSVGSGPTAMAASTITLDAGAVPKMLEGPNDTKKTGFRYGVLTDFVSTASFDADEKLVADYAYHSKLISSAEEAGTVVCGTAANNVVTLAWTKGQIVNDPSGARDGWKTRNIELDLNTGFTIAFS